MSSHRSPVSKHVLIDMLIDTFMCEYGFLSVPTPYLSPYGYPNDVPGGQKSVKDEKKRLSRKRASLGRPGATLKSCGEGQTRAQACHLR